MNITVSVSKTMCFEPSTLREANPKLAFTDIDTFIEHLKYYIIRKGVLNDVTVDQINIDYSEATSLYNACMKN